MNDEVEASRGQHAEIVHGSLKDLQIDPSLAGHLPIEFEHRRRQIDHGDAGPCRRVERPVLAAARGEAEHLEPIEPVGQPAAAGGTAAAQP